MRLQAFQWTTGLVISPHNIGAPAGPQGPAAAGGQANMADLFPSNDEAFSGGLGNFITVATANLSAVGLVSADITALTDAKDVLDDAIADNISKLDAAKASTAAKKTARLATDAALRAAIDAAPDEMVAKR